MPAESRLVVVAASCMLLLSNVPPLSAQQQHRVLTLLAMRQDAPGSIAMEEVIHEKLNEQLPGALDYYAEYLDVGRFADPDYSSALREFLKRKYSGYDFDLVVAATNSAVDFLRGHRDELFPGVPVVFSTSPGDDAGPNSTGLTHTVEMAGSVEMALQLQPHVRQVFVLSGTAPSDRYYADLTREQLRHLENRLSIVYWDEFTLQEAIQRVATLPPDAILYAMPFTEDRSGQRFNPVPALQAVTAVANVPVYHFSNLAMGYGVVGGALHNTAVLAEGLADLSLRVLRGERPDDIPLVPIDVLRLEVDWRQLQRWDISEARLPAGTVIRFREPGVWERYRSYIIATGVLVLLQTALIGGLLVQRVRRRRVETALRTSEAALRKSRDQNQDLAGRLISAQEAERARIARDLHDDVSQQLAGLAITVSGVRHRLKVTHPDGDIDKALVTMQEVTSALAHNVRSLSHEMHSGALQYAGLVPALEEHCSTFERHHRIDVTLTSDGEIDPLPPDVALCLYRIVQEALANIARHARARTALVRLARTDDGVELEVVDDGVGFDAQARKGNGLGLRSIEERVRLARGGVRIESHPGRGTTLIVRVPSGGAAVAAGNVDNGV